MNKPGEKSFWTIVFTELTYAKPLIVGSFLLIGLPTIFSILTQLLFRESGADIIQSADGLGVVIALVGFMVCFVMLLFEIRESRLRQMVSLPMSISNIRMWRILLPLVVCFIYLLLLVSCITLLAIGNEIGMSALGIAGQDGIWNDVAVGPIIQEFGKRTAWLLACLYAQRLLTEWQGRVFLGAIVLALIYIGNSDNSQIFDEIWGILPWGFPVVSILLLYASFRSRKAFLE
jgi:hypothetical protein